MANQIKMADAIAIQALASKGWSHRRIARELGVHRETVARYVREAEERQSSKPAKAPPGSDPPEPLSCQRQAGSDEASSGSKPATDAEAPPGSDGSHASAPASSGRSQCEPHRELIRAGLEQGLSAKRIWQDLRSEHGISVSYYSVRRFVTRLGQASPLPFRRLECSPGEQAELDFGHGAPVVAANGRRRRTWFFRILLSHSRKGYTEAVFRQTTDDLIRCLENAFDASRDSRTGPPLRVAGDDRGRAHRAHGAGDRDRSTGRPAAAGQASPQKGSGASSLNTQRSSS